MYAIVPREKLGGQNGMLRADKPFHGRWPRGTRELAEGDNWTWLREKLFPDDS